MRPLDLVLLVVAVVCTLMRAVGVPSGRLHLGWLGVAAFFMIPPLRVVA